MDKLREFIPVEIKVTPQDVAELFCSMDENEQADFFNSVAELVKDWKHPFCLQMQYVTDSFMLNDYGREIMKTIGDYSQKTLKNQ